MTQTKQLAGFFDRKSAAFDAIYSGDKNAVLRLWDKLTRRNLQVRFEFTLDVGAPWEGKRVLDVGCGSGRYGFALAERGVREVVGLDISSEMIALANRLAQELGVADRCRFVQSEALAFQDDDGFDVTIANGFFDYVTDPAPVLARLRTLTNGPLVATFPAAAALRTPFRWAWIRIHRCPIKFYAHGEVESLFRQAGYPQWQIKRSGPIYMVAADSR